MPAEIQRMLVCTTGNLPGHEADILEMCACDANITCFQKGDYGWFVYAHSEVDTNLVPQLANILKYATHVWHVEWVCFDRDAEPLPGFPTYEWN